MVPEPDSGGQRQAGKPDPLSILAGDFFNTLRGLN